ncbi:hypothetical protein M426DRAFT_260907 [Hypoxylon sp. CI-4A]|nr:hypothetical protein M426DRAFT_260907 [Hypoxylon sp. CI-4A]
MKKQIADIHRVGLTVLYEPDKDTSDIDIIFIHGFEGHPVDTRFWSEARKDPSSFSLFGHRPEIPIRRRRQGYDDTPDTDIDDDDKTDPSPYHQREGTYWPQDLLPVQCPRARILTWGYDSSSIRGIDAMNYKHHAEEFIFDYEHERSIGRGIIFVAYSFGGFVVKELLSQCEGSNNHEVLENTRAVVFLGTPHGESEDEPYSSGILRMVHAVQQYEEDETVLQTLGVDCQSIDQANKSFIGQWHQYQFVVRSFQEGSATLGRGFSSPTKVYIIPDMSSHFHVLRARAETLSKIYIDLSRFSGRDDPSYVKIGLVIARLADDLDYSVDTYKQHERFDSSVVIEGILNQNDVKTLRDLMRTHFDEIAVGKYAWLEELVRANFSSDEIADLILEAKKDSPWISFEPKNYDRLSIQSEFHLENCAHHLLDQLLLRQFPRREQTEDTSSPPIHQQGVMRMVQELCGLAGELQRLELCCDALTVLVRPEQDYPTGTVRLSHLPLSWASCLFEYLNKSRDYSGTAQVRIITKATEYAIKIIQLVAPAYTEPGSGRSDVESLSICALATQTLCMVLISYAQGHVGPIDLFFLDTKLDTVDLKGSKYGMESVVIKLDHLACMSGALGGQAITFGTRPRSLRVNPLPSPSLGRFSVETNVEDLLDTWGPGELIVHKDQPGLVSAIKLAKGVVWCTDRESGGFHWSQNIPEQPPEPVVFQKNTRLLIGSLVTFNRHYPTDMVQRRGNCVRYLEQIGPQKPYWEMNEKQAVLQGGLYVVLQGTAGWHKLPGRTLKEHRLHSDDEALLGSLNEVWGLEVSFCTRVAQRVFLREVIANLLDIFLSIYAFSEG